MPTSESASTHWKQKNITFEGVPHKKCLVTFRRTHGLFLTEPRKNIWAVSHISHKSRDLDHDYTWGTLYFCFENDINTLHIVFMIHAPLTLSQTSLFAGHQGCIIYLLLGHSPWITYYFHTTEKSLFKLIQLFNGTVWHPFTSLFLLLNFELTWFSTSADIEGRHPTTNWFS